MRDTGTRHIKSDAQHRLFEELSILAFRDCLRVGTDQLHIVSGERAVAVQFHGGIERGLAAHRG